MASATGGDGELLRSGESVLRRELHDDPLSDSEPATYGSSELEDLRESLERLRDRATARTPVDGSRVRDQRRERVRHHLNITPIEKSPWELERLWEWTERLEKSAWRENVERVFWAPNTLLWSLEHEGERIGHLCFSDILPDHSAQFHLLVYDRHPLRYVAWIREFVEETISELGLKVLLMTFWTGYSSTPKLVKRLGFRIVGKVPDLLYADGSSLDAWICYKTPVARGWLERIREWVGAQQ